MADNSIDKLMRDLKSMGSDIKASSGRLIPNGKPSVVASSSSTDFTKKLVEIEGIISEHGMRTVKIDKNFLEITE